MKKGHVIQLQVLHLTSHPGEAFAEAKVVRWIVLRRSHLWSYLFGDHLFRACQAKTSLRALLNDSVWRGGAAVVLLSRNLISRAGSMIKT